MNVPSARRQPSWRSRSKSASLSHPSAATASPSRARGHRLLERRDRGGVAGGPGTRRAAIFTAVNGKRAELLGGACAAPKSSSDTPKPFSLGARAPRAPAASRERLLAHPADDPARFGAALTGDLGEAVGEAGSPRPRPRHSIVTRRSSPRREVGSSAHARSSRVVNSADESLRLQLRHERRRGDPARSGRQAGHGRGAGHLPVARSTIGRKRVTICPASSASVTSAAVTRRVAPRRRAPPARAGSAASSSPRRRAVSGFSIAPSSCRP